MIGGIVLGVGNWDKAIYPWLLELVLGRSHPSLVEERRAEEGKIGCSGRYRCVRYTGIMDPNPRFSVNLPSVHCDGDKDKNFFIKHISASTSVNECICLYSAKHGFVYEW